MSTDVNLSKDDREMILIAIAFWLDEIAQEDTNKEDFLHMIRLKEKFLKLVPWRDL
jgi:hypothetical protein